MFLNKKGKESDKAEQERETFPCIDAAKDIAQKYDELSNCCKLLSEVEHVDDGDFCHSFTEIHNGGWRVWAHTVEGAGIDLDEVYAFIGYLAKKRKTELECSLASVCR